MNLDLPAVERSIQYSFKEPRLLEEALTHRSFSEENAGAVQNGRLAFIGDAVVQLVVTRLLVAHATAGDLRKLRQGALTQRRQGLVNNARFSRMSEFFGISPRTSRGEGALDGKPKMKRLASAFEAVIGAVYEDTGFQLDQTAVVVERLFERHAPGQTLWAAATER